MSLLYPIFLILLISPCYYSFDVDPPRILLSLFSTQRIPTEKNLDRIINMLSIEQEARLNTLTSDRLLANIKEYRKNGNRQALHQLRKLSHDYATESRRMVERFLTKKKHLPHSMPLIALYHIRRVISEMKYLRRDEKEALLADIDQCRVPFEGETERMDRIKNKTRDAFKITSDTKLFFANRLSITKQYAVHYYLIEFVEESGWPVSKKLETLQLLKQYHETQDVQLLRPLASQFTI